MSLETNKNFFGTRIGIEPDITKRKQAQDARNQSRRYLQALFDNSLDGILVINDEACYVDANPAACAQLGYTHEELMQLSILDLTAAPYHQEGWAIWQQLLERGTQSGEYPIVCKDGKVIRVEFRAVANILPGVHVAFIREITERKRAEEALRASEERYRELFESARDAIYVHDLKGVYVSVNRAGEKLSGYPRDEIVGKHFTEFVAPEQVDQVRHKLARKLITQQGASYVVEAIAKDGRRVPVEVNSNLLYENGAPVAVQGLARDITERLSAERAIRQAEQKYRDIFENAGEGIFQSTPEGQFLAANPALARMLGYDSPKELILSLKDISTQIYVDANGRDEFRHLLAEQEMVRGFEHQVFKKDGATIWISVNARAVRDEQGRLLYYEGTAQDITETKCAADRLREYEKVVEGLEEMIVVIDRDYRYLIANRAFLKYRGASREELVGHQVPEFLGEEIFEKVVKKNLDECFKGKVVKYEMTFTYREIGERNLFISYFPIEGTAGIDRVAAVLQDVTEQKRAEEALRQSEERFSKAFHSSPAALSVALLEDGRLLEVNDAFLRMTGYTRDEVIGRSTLELGLWVDSNQRIKMAGLLHERGTEADLEIIFCKKSGEVRNGLLSVDVIELSGKPCVLGIAQDITERKRAEAALRNYSRLLIEAQEAERQKIARELHDQIGQVLTAVRINLHNIRKSCETAESRSLIDEGMGMVDQALEQVRDLSFELRPSLLDDLGLIAALRWYADRYTQRTGIRTTMVADLPVDQIRLRKELETACFRIVQEALTNVARHARAKNISINLATLNHEIILSIKDDGIGFDEPAPDGAASASRLGLRGMKERALGLGGRLEISSSSARGTEIRAYF
jgi:PAS domain S-box-containing protein